MSHNDEKIDRYLGKRVTLTDFEGKKIRGTLTYDSDQGKYRMINVIDNKGFPSGDWLFRKSHIKKIEA